MGRIRTTLVGRRHAYTSADLPWQMDVETGEKPALFRYLRGGGVRAFAGSAARDILARRQSRFLVCMAALAALWLALWLA